MIDVPLSLEQYRLVWLVGSILLYVLSVNIAWTVQAVKWSGIVTFLSELIRFGYYVGIPYFALLDGVVTLKSMGYHPMSQAENLDRGFFIAGIYCVLILVLGWYARRVLSNSKSPRGISKGRPFLIVDWMFTLINMLFRHVHWAYYLALPVLILNDRYLGGFLGLALILGEAYANPSTRHRLGDPAETEFLLLNAGLAVLSSVLYVITGVSWLGLTSHFALVVIWIVATPYQPHPQATKI